MDAGILSAKLKPETKVYRTISKERLFGLFANNENVLVRPSKWEDPFENFLLNSPVEIGHALGDLSFKNDIYGQCWTLTGFSDAMWRIYSKETDGIRIKSTVGKLIESLRSATPNHKDISCFIGKVNYCRDVQLRKFADNHFRDGLGNDGKKIAETLLIKRNAFRHEKEVRLIYFSPENQPAERDLHTYSINPHEVIEQIMLHPQLSIDEASRLKDDVCKNTRFKGQIVQSKLYRLPKGFRIKVPN